MTERNLEDVIQANKVKLEDAIWRWVQIFEEAHGVKVEELQLHDPERGRVGVIVKLANR